jgi:hypothetical protein
MRTIVVPLLLTATAGLGACASTPESRLRNEIFLDVYWRASRECEGRYRTLHVERIGIDGSLSVTAFAESRAEAQPFRECYWNAVKDRAERRRSAGLAMPDELNLHPDIDID